MSTSYHVCGIIPADEKYKQMLEIYDLCKKVNISLPKEINEFFNYSVPNKTGIIIDLGEDGLNIAKEYAAEYEWGWEVDIDKIPKSIKTIRFYGSC